MARKTKSWSRLSSTRPMPKAGFTAAQGDDPPSTLNTQLSPSLSLSLSLSLSVSLSVSLSLSLSLSLSVSLSFSLSLCLSVSPRSSWPPLSRFVRPLQVCCEYGRCRRCVMPARGFKFSVVRRMKWKMQTASHKHCKVCCHLRCKKRGVHAVDVKAGRSCYLEANSSSRRLVQHQRSPEVKGELNTLPSSLRHPRRGTQILSRSSAPHLSHA